MFQLTLTTHTGQKTLLESNDPIEMANFIFENGYYKQGVEMDHYIDLITPIGSFTGGKLDQWIEDQIPQRVNILTNKQIFQCSLLGQFLLKLRIIDDWYVDYLKNSSSEKFRV